MVEPRKISFPEHFFQTIQVSDYTVPALPTEGKVRVMELVSRLVTQERVVELEDSKASEDLVRVLALDRLGTGKSFMGLLKGFGLQQGACGTTMSWDSGDLIVVGCDEPSIETAIERIKTLAGGAVFALQDEVVAEFRAPLCGVLSLEPIEEIAEQVKKLEAALRQHGVKWEKPLLTIDTLTSAAIPHLRITHSGYVRFKDRQMLSLEV
jgi:adenine deaminase